MSANSEEDESLPEKPARWICSECEKLKKEFENLSTKKMVSYVQYVERKSISS